jgi:hypothetical protein
VNTAPLELGRFRFRVPDTKFNGKGELWANMTKKGKQGMEGQLKACRGQENAR